MNTSIKRCCCCVLKAGCVVTVHSRRCGPESLDVQSSAEGLEQAFGHEQEVDSVIRGERPSQLLTMRTNTLQEETRQRKV